MSQLKKYLILFLLTIFSTTSWSQGCPDVNTCAVFSPTLSPSIDWKNEFWATSDMNGNDNVLQHESDEDWHYNLMEYKVNGVPAGYIGIGFAGINGFDTFTMNDENDLPITCYQRDNGTLDGCVVFESENRRKNLHRQSIVYYDFDGNIIDYKLYNFGDLYSGVQDSNGNIYLAGLAVNPTDITKSEEIDANDEPLIDNVPLYYNPTSTTQDEFDISSNLNCTTAGTFQFKFNVLKIDVAGNLQWNNYYGIEDGISNGFAARGHAYTIVLDNDQVIVGGRAVQINQGTESNRKFVAAIDKDTGYLNWKGDIDPTQSGSIFDITKQGDNYLLSGTEFLGIPETNAFVSLHYNASTSGFLNPLFKKTPDDIPIQVIQAENFPTINQSEVQKSNSAIFIGNDIYWFIMVNGDNNFGAANFKGQGAVVKMNMSGGFNEIDDIGPVRAYDMWLSGTPTDDGGFALVTTKQSPDYYGTANIPTRGELLNENNPNSDNIGDCLDLLQTPNCPDFNDGSKFFDLMSTCSYIRKYNSNFEFQWDKIWDSTDNAPRECFPYNLKQQECVYKIIQSSQDGGLLIAGNTSSNFDDSYMVKLKSDCALADFAGLNENPNPDLIVGFDDGVYEIDGNVIWDTPKKVVGMIKVNAGATLTINNTTVEFASNTDYDSGINVMPTGELYIDNSTLTSMDGCGEMWRGIEVWGSFFHPQTIAHQGKLTMRNDATIQNAELAVALTHLEEGNLLTDLDHDGGIIDARNANFINNKQSILIPFYQDVNANGFNIPNRTYFNLCNFELNDDYIGGTEAANNSMVTMWKVDGVRFSACNFTNTRSVATSPERNRAIFSLDANFRVHGYCGAQQLPEGDPCPEVDLTKSVFDGFDIAIDATAAAENGAPQVKEAVFKNNLVGISFDALTLPSAVSNEFFIGEYSLPFDEGDANYQVGIVVNKSPEYTIEQNEFEKAGSNTWDTHGVLIKKAGGLSNELYKNEFNNLSGASIAMGENATTLGYEGLRFICNKNIGNRNDFELRPTDSNEPAFVSRIQDGGSPALAAGNTFSVATSPLDNIYTHFDFTSNGVYEYRYDNTAIGETPSPAETRITDTDGDIILTDMASENTCETNFPDGEGFNINVHQTKYKTVKAEYNDLLYPYLLLIDDGNTQGMVDEIDLSWPSDAWNLHAQLMALSPYNSETVLTSAIDRNIVPHGMLLEILMANPDALRSGSIVKHIRCCMANPLPEYMLDILALVATDVQTARTEMERNLGGLQLNMVRSHKQILQHHLHDTIIGTHPDTLMHYYSGIRSLRGRYQQMLGYIESNDFTSAESVLDSITLNYKLTVKEGVEYVSLIAFVDILQIVNNNNRTLAELTRSEIDDLEDLSNTADAGIAAARADNILCFFYGICPGAPPVPKNNSVQARKANTTLEELLANENKVQAWPNPADEFMQIEYNLLFSKPNAYIRIMDMHGRVIETWNISDTQIGLKLLDTRKLTSGIYLYEISQGGKRIKSDKIIIQH